MNTRSRTLMAASALVAGALALHGLDDTPRADAHSCFETITSAGRISRPLSR